MSHRTSSTRTVRNTINVRWRPLALLALAAATPIAHAQVGVMLSQTPSANPGNGISRVTPGGAVSTYGRHVVFVSGASDLVSGDTNNAEDAFAYDLVTGALARVSVSSSGAQAGVGGGYGQFGMLSAGAAISRDGRYVTYASPSSDLVTGDTNGWSDVFRHDRDTDGDGIFDEPGAISTSRVSLTNGGGQGNQYSEAPSISGMGRYVCFVSAASNLIAGGADTNGVKDIFVRDTRLGTTTRVSVSSGGVQADAASGSAMISADGRWVAFSSNATNLVAGDTNAASDAFLHDTQTGQTTRISVSSSGAQGNGGSGVSAISADGRFVAIESYASNLVSGDTNATRDIFVHDTVAATTVRVSIASNGAQANDESFGASVSDNGQYIAFISKATNIGPNTPYYAFKHDRDADGNGIFDESGGTATTVASRLPPSAFFSSNSTGPSQQYVAIAGNGDSVIWGNGSDAQVYSYAPGSVDTDADGLADLWEVVGVDADVDGVIDLQLPAAVSPAHKDLIVEIDAMTGRLPATATLAQIQQAYAAAPNALVNNPDGQPGVTLHLLVDETAIQRQVFDGNNPWPFPVAANPPQNTFAWHRNQFKGTAAQRGSANWTNIRLAILMTQRYCLFADRINGTTVSGQAEFIGNDFYITLGGWTPIGGTAADQVGLFMHELGHNLGLGHGGAQWDPANPWNDRFNYKPNYHSVMNYTWTVPAGQLAASWTPDYSRAAWATLDETNLNEQAGVGGHAGHNTMFGPPGTGGHNPCPTTFNAAWPYIGAESGPIDWDRNCATNGTGIRRDINDPWGFNPGSWTGDVLTGFNDWSNLIWTLGGNNQYLDTDPEVVPFRSEPTFDLKRLPEQMGWFETFEEYNVGEDMHTLGGWETWCQDGESAHVADTSPLGGSSALQVSFDGSAQYGSDVVKPFAIDSGKWSLSMQTYVPTGAAGRGYIMLLNQYCLPRNNWSMQVEFNELTGMVESQYDGALLPLIRDRWVEFRVEIDLDNDRFTQYYDGQVLGENLVWTMNASGHFGQQGIQKLGAMDLFSLDIAEMYFDNMALEPQTCYADCNVSTGAGVLDIFDFLCFQDRFISGDPYACDCDTSTGPGVCDIFDFLCFQSAFTGGCN